MDLAEAVDELYGAPLADFVAVRTRLVARAKEEAPGLVDELKTLRKPTVVAWLLNRVARSEPEVVADLLDLGERMRTAQAKGDGAALSAARPERHEAIEALVAAARRCGEETGTPFGAGAADGVSSTAVAALADPASGEALASGRLLRPLAYAGFGEVELDDAVAVLRLVPPLSQSDDDPEGADDETELEVAETDDADGVDESEDAEDTEDAEDAEDAHAAAEARAAADAAAERARERELAEAREDLREHERALGAARLAHSEALAALEAAAADVGRLEEEVARATGTVADLETRPND
ncbi:hypothetical protein [Janibacter sp. DB-40]|uniref:hypothetical protein n=1 Tax=Janibacter sp. DB-40 TaxID=3028808 RepID=UPI002405E72D|nr:hypothetical protein [Janibacter sp. DB-40]